MSSNTATTTIYSLDDVSKHNTKKDLWMTIHDKVYNVTEFVLEVRYCLFFFNKGIGETNLLFFFSFFFFLFFYYEKKSILVVSHLQGTVALHVINKFIAPFHPIGEEVLLDEAGKLNRNKQEK
jgi:hypothetical protein